MPFGVLALLVVAAGGLSAEDYCDPGLRETPGDPDGYRMREGRCEGLFVRDVGINPALMVVSLVQAFDPFDPASPGALHVAWTSPDPSKPVSLRGHGLRRKQYYRMDTVRPAGQRSFEWPKPVLARLSITRETLGLVCWTSLLIDGQPRDVYLPLTIGAKTKADHAVPLELLLMPGAELSEVFVTLNHAEERGQAGAAGDAKRELGYGFYPAERPVRIPIAGLKHVGFYQVAISAVLRYGGSASTEFWFYVPPR